MFENADLIHRCSRTDAIRDGVLIDVTETAREAGIRWPVALTAGVPAECVAVRPGVVFQDEAARLWDVLFCSAVPSAAATAPASRASASTSETTAENARRHWCA
jgi:hypothetical protein